MSKTLLEKNLLTADQCRAIVKNRKKVLPALWQMSIYCTQVKLAMFFENNNCGCNCPKELWEQIEPEIIKMGYTISNVYASGNSTGFMINW